MQQEQILFPKGATVRDPHGGRYVVEGLLGRGASGAVYLVSDKRVKQNVFALKEVINPNKRDRERFTFEGEILKRLHHRALPRVYHSFEHDNLKRVYILMDYVKGRNLEDLREEQPEKCFSLPLVLALVSPIVDALIYLHSQDPPIIHRDIKPANIVVPIGADEAMLVDFGSAKEYAPDGLTTVLSHRSPGYAAPEQYVGGTNTRTDIYGLGATLYLLLTGTVPIDALSRVVRDRSTGADPLKPANLLRPIVPAAVAEALQRSMSLSSADRFETVEEFWQVLKAHASEKQLQIPRVTSGATPQPLPERGTKRTLGAFFQKKQDTTRSWKQIGLLLISLLLLVTVAIGTALLSHNVGLTVLLLIFMLTVLLALIPLLRR